MHFQAPGRRTIVRCALNRRQVAIALAGGELVYFELDVVSFFCKYNIPLVTSQFGQNVRSLVLG